MNYNIDFEISALAFLLVVICYFFIKRKYINLQGKIYSFYVLFIFFNIVTNIISVYLIEDASSVPLIVNEIVNDIYMCSQLFIPAILMFYILSLTNKMKKRVLIFFSLPISFGVLMVLLNPLTHFYFYFNEQAQYIYGAGHIYLYINCFIYIALTLWLVITYRKLLGASLFFSFFAILMIMVMGMIYQYYNPEDMITGTGAVLSQLLLYMAMENPDNYSDSLTSALNEGALKSKLKTIYEHGSSSHLVILSMSDFKMINDVFGRKLGDAMLKQIADYLINESNKQNVFRFNGDIFAVLKENEEASYTLMYKINERLNSEWVSNNINVRLSGKLGLMNTVHYKDEEEFFIMLEYFASEMKKNKDKLIHVVDECEKEKLVRNATIKRAIADIIARGHIEMAYQPIYYSDGKLRALESLARMKLVKYGYISPDEFIRMSETTGSILQLGNVIIKEVINFIEDNRERFDEGLIVGINLSVIQVMSPSFSKQLLNKLDEKRINHKNIVFEITESEAIYSDSTVIENLCLLKDAGIRLAMDDYGKGYANINSMIDIPFSTIKLDKQVIWNSMDNLRARIILVNTVKMLKDLNFDIIAEGIETKEQLDEMASLSINLFQGYYFTKPISRFEIWQELDKVKQKLEIEFKKE